MGMTSDEYWNGDPELARSYRKAAKLKSEMDDQRAWNAGMYVYDAILRASPILRSFGKKGTKPEPYPEEPYSETSRKKMEERKNQKVQNPDAIKFEAWAIAWNQRFKEKKEAENGG